MNIIATGAGKSSNIDIVGSDIWGKQGTTLIADNQVNIKAAEQTHQERSTNKSSGFNAGVAIGKGVSAGLTVGGNYGKGYGNGDETTYVASHVGDIQSKTVIQAGGDANVIGSGIQGKRVQLSAENLNIESLQNKASYDGKQMNVNGSITVGYGFSAEGGYSKSKMNSNHASVNEQAGIYAGDEGYDVNVKNHTDLKGALITSTQQAESSGLNQFSTGTLSHSDIENHSSYKGSSIGISAKGDANGGWTGQEKNGISGGVGYGRESDNQDSVTKSGINTQNIEIRNENAQQARTGKSITETLTAIKTDISTDNAESQSGKLENRFDKNALQKELNVQVEATKGFVQTASAAGNAIANKLGEEAVAKQREAQAAQEVADRAYKANPSKENETALNTANQNLITANNEADKWQTGGEYKRKIDGAMNAISAALGGLPAAGIATSALSPEINHQIKLATEGSPMANKVAHALWGAVEAYSANQNAAAGAGGALAGEVMADVIAKELYGKKPNQLNREEKEVVSSVSQAAGALVGGAAANSSQGIGVGLTTAKNAVENNYLSVADVENLIRELSKAQKEGRDTKPILEKYKGISEENRQQLIACNGNVACETAHLHEMNTGAEELERNLGFFSRMTVYYPNDLNTANRTALFNLVESEYAESFSKLSDTTKFGLNLMEAGTAIGLGAVAGSAKVGFSNVKSLISGKNKAYPTSGMDGYKRANVGDEDYRLSGAENAALYPKLKEELAMKQKAGFEKVVKDLSKKPTGSVLMIPDYRHQLSEARSTLSPKLQRSGNAAVAQINIDGLTTRKLVGHSQIDKAQGSFVGQGETKFESLKLPNKKGDLIDRRVDSEYKILSNLADQLGSNRQAKGQVTIFTERPACLSCLGVVDQFTKRYPNIKVNVFDNNGKAIKHNGEK